MLCIYSVFNCQDALDVVFVPPIVDAGTVGVKEESGIHRPLRKTHRRTKNGGRTAGFVDRIYRVRIRTRQGLQGLPGRVDVKRRAELFDARLGARKIPARLPLRGLNCNRVRSQATFAMASQM